MRINIAGTPAEKKLAYDVRTTVFVKEQNVPPDLELDAYDEHAIHFVGYEEDEPVAAARVRFVDNYGKLERICVQKDWRGKSLGKQIIKAMEKTIQEKGYTKAKLNAQTHALPFYERLGYEVVSDEFMDAGIPHKAMIKELN